MKTDCWVLRLGNDDLKLEVSKEDRQILLFGKKGEQDIGLLALNLYNARRVHKALGVLIKQLETMPEDVVQLHPEQFSLFMTKVVRG